MKKYSPVFGKEANLNSLIMIGKMHKSRERKESSLLLTSIVLTPKRMIIRKYILEGNKDTLSVN